MNTSILAVRNLSKSYGRGTARFDALKGVSLEIQAGESLAIVGKSGSGKSTLRHLLALLDKPDGGELLVKGTDADELGVKRVSQLRNEDFGFVFQQFFLTPNASVLQNVVLPLKIAGVGARERRTRVWRFLSNSTWQRKPRTRPSTSLVGRSSAWSSPGLW